MVAEKSLKFHKENIQKNYQKDLLRKNFKLFN